MQFDLFEERTRRLSSGRRALYAFDLPVARHEFQALLARHPQDDDALASLEVTERLMRRLSLLQEEQGDLVRALLMMENEIAEDYKKGWHRCLAGEVERSLRDTLRQSPGDARARAFLGDVLYLKGDSVGARSEYLLAFLVGPAAVVLGRLADPGVAALPELARSLYGASDDFLDWVPAVGMEEGVFFLPPPVIPGLLDPVPEVPERDTPGLLFYRCILDERAATTREGHIEVRRRMKASCPELFAVYLERFYV